MSCNKIAVYSPEDINVMIGPIQVTGFSLDSIVSITKINETYAHNINADGTVSRTHKGDHAFNVAISLSNTSDWNEVLSYMLLVDRGLQMGKFPLMISDSQGTSLFFSATSWVERMPDSNISTTLDNRDWLICCSHAVFNVGGNYEVGGAARDIVSVLAGGAGILGSVL